MCHAGILGSVLSLCVLLSGSVASAQPSGSSGTEFWLGFLQNYSGAEELSVFISAPYTTSGIISMPLAGWSTSFTVVPNVTTTLTIPVALAEHTTSEVISQKGILIQTQDPVSVFAINFKSFTADATQVFPTPTHGSSYRVQSYAGLNDYPSEFLIVSTRNGTQVEITPTVITEGGNLPGIPFTVDLDSAETFQVQAQGTGDFTGTMIRGTDTTGTCSTFAVFSGVGCTNVPIGCSACDHIFSQALPTYSWGTSFLGAPFLGTSGCTYRVLADQDSTWVSVNAGPPTLLQAGELLDLPNFAVDMNIESTLPVSVAQIMQGAGCSNVGDPAMVLLHANDETIDQVTFATVVSTVITDHSVNIVADSSAVGFLQLDGTPLAPAFYTPFSAAPGYVWAQVPVSQGSHTLSTSVGSFVSYAYGSGGYESYTYSTGSVRSLYSSEYAVICTTSGTALTLTSALFLSNGFWSAASDPLDTLGTGQTLLVTPTTNETYVYGGVQPGFACSLESVFDIDITSPTQLSVGNDTLLCAGAQLPLFAAATPPNGSYQYAWDPPTALDQPTAQNPVSTPYTNVTYTATVSTALGCPLASDSISIAIITELAVDLGPDTALCPGATLSLDAGFPGSSYTWSTGASTQTILVQGASVSSVIVIDPYGCVGSDSIAIALSPAPAAPQVTWVANTHLATALVPNVIYQWALNGTDIPGANIEQWAPMSNGSYTVTITNVAGCSATSLPYLFLNIGIEEQVTEILPLWPNPASDVLNLPIPDYALRDIDLQLIDASGRITPLGSPLKGYLNVGRLAAGTYLLRIIEPDRVRLCRFVKE